MVCSYLKSPGMESSGFGFQKLSRLSLAGELGDLDDHKFGRLERREGHHDVDDAVVNVRLGGGLTVALHLEGLARRIALKRSLAEQTQHERLDGGPDRRPQRLVIRLEYH